MQYLLLAVAFLSSTLTLAAPSGRGFAYSPEVSPGVHPGLEPHCVKMEMDLESCFKEDDLTGDISVDQETIKECVCGNESFSMEVVTSCTEDPFAWSDVCGDRLKMQEVEMGLEVVL